MAKARRSKTKAQAKRSSSKRRQIRRSGMDAVAAAQAKRAGADFEWHFGRITRLGNHEIAGGRSVTIIWEEGSVTSQQGDISDEQWEIFKLAFTTTGRVAILSDQPGDAWTYDFRFLEAVR